MISLAIYSCASKKQFAVNAPKEYYIKSSLEPQESTLPIQFEIDRSKLQNLISTSIPEVLYETDKNSEEQYLLIVSRDGGIKLSTANGKIRSSIMLNIKAKAKINLGFFQQEVSTEFKIVPTYETEILFDNYYKIKTATTFLGLEWIVKPIVQIGPVEVDITPYLKAMLETQLRKVADFLDKSILERNILDGDTYLKPLVEILDFQKPISTDPAVWMAINEKKIYQIYFTENTSSIQLLVTLKGKVESSIGNKFASSTKEKLSVMTVSLSDTLADLAISSSFDLDYISNLITKNIDNELLSQSISGNKVSIDKLEFYGSGEYLVSKIQVKGDVNGTIYATCIPIVSETGDILLKDLDYSIDTKNKVIKIYDWFAKNKLLTTISKLPYLQKDYQTISLQKLVDQKINSIEIGDLKMKINAKLISFTAKQISIEDKKLVLSTKVSLNIKIQIP